MIRAMAVGTSIATQRLIFVPALIALGGTIEVARWASVSAFAVAFGVHCIVAEWWIRSPRGPAGTAEGSAGSVDVYGAGGSGAQISS